MFRSTASAQHAGSLIAVASFGEYEVIQNYLNLITPGVFNRANICTPSCVGGTDGCTVQAGKVPMIEYLIDTMTKQPVEQYKARTVLFDDQADNIEVSGPTSVTLSNRRATYTCE
eukprot:8762479-Pyramimonas_sp.AAC.1